MTLFVLFHAYVAHIDTTTTSTIIKISAKVPNWKCRTERSHLNNVGKTSHSLKPQSMTALCPASLLLMGKCLCDLRATCPRLWEFWYSFCLGEISIDVAKQHLRLTVMTTMLDNRHYCNDTDGNDDSRNMTKLLATMMMMMMMMMMTVVMMILMMVMTMMMKMHDEWYPLRCL